MGGSPRKIAFGFAVRFPKLLPKYVYLIQGQSAKIVFFRHLTEPNQELLPQSLIKYSRKSHYLSVKNQIFMIWVERDSVLQN